MNRKKANDYYTEYKLLQDGMFYLESQVEERLLFLIKKYKDCEYVFRLNEHHTFTITQLSNIVIKHVSIEDKIHYIDAIENWIETQQTFVQLKMF